MRPRHQISFRWPNPPFNIVLVEPEIPQNTGNIARLCAATGTVLNLIEPLGFRLTDREVKRAGLDYWDAVEIRRFQNLEKFESDFSKHRKIFFSTSGHRNYTEAEYRPGDCLIFGSESRGLPLELLESHPDDVFNIPMKLENVRSLNLANAASIVLYEALRQSQGFACTETTKR
ncbi:MAG: tRNA (cytidine(34)-2'-O)-methyltransferase [Kiritimatiellaceae bacterium]|nr:tRNA (cytidine(34)-2'-O)-methyltransferase [Kiritimatiellaceae bacterium]